MLAGNKERIFSDHEIPADGGVARHIGPAASQAQTLGRFAPAFGDIPKSPDRQPVVTEKQVVVIDGSTGLEALIEIELTLQGPDRSGAKLNDPVFARLGHVPIHPIDPRLGDGERSPDFIKVPHSQRNLFGGSKSREETALVKVALSLTPILMNRGNKLFRILDAKRVNARYVAAFHASTFQRPRGIGAGRMVPVAKLKRPTQHAQLVVVGLLAPVCMR